MMRFGWIEGTEENLLYIIGCHWMSTHRPQDAKCTCFQQNKTKCRTRTKMPPEGLTTCFELLLAFTVGPTFQHATKRCFLVPSEAKQCDRLRCKALNRRKLEPNIIPPKWDFNGSFYIHKCYFLSPDHEHHEFKPPSQQTSIFPTSVASRYCPTINFVAVNRSSNHQHPIGETRKNLQS